MPGVLVDDVGTILHYDESGAPKGSTDYTTVFLVHGTMLHGAIFKPMFAYAASQKLRLVALNVRDYPGSTPYSPQDYQDMKGSIEAQGEQIRKRGLELAALISWFIDTEKIPPMSLVPNSNGLYKGGFSLLGWSAGNAHILSLVGNAHRLTVRTRVLFDSYFRTLILYDPSMLSLGSPSPSELYSVFRDRSLTLDQRTAVFPTWVSTYFPAPGMGPESPDFVRAVIQSRKPPHAPARDVDFRRTPTVERMTPLQLAAVTDVSVMSRSQYTVQLVDSSVTHDNLRRAVFDCELDNGSGVRRVIWPALIAQHVWCDRSIGDCLVVSTSLAKEVDMQKQGRRLETYRLEQANHFAHWDEPARFTKFLAQIISYPSNTSAGWMGDVASHL